MKTKQFLADRLRSRYCYTVASVVVVVVCL